MADGTDRDDSTPEHDDVPAAESPDAAEPDETVAEAEAGVAVEPEEPAADVREADGPATDEAASDEPEAEALATDETESDETESDEPEADEAEPEADEDEAEPDDAGGEPSEPETADDAAPGAADQAEPDAADDADPESPDDANAELAAELPDEPEPAGEPEPADEDDTAADASEDEAPGNAAPEDGAPGSDVPQSDAPARDVAEQDDPVAPTVVMPPVRDVPPAPTADPAPAAARTEVLTPYGAMSAPAPDKATDPVAPVRTSAFGARAAAMQAAPSAQAVPPAATPTAQNAPTVQPEPTQSAQSAATATLPPTSTGPARPADRGFTSVPQADRTPSLLDAFEPQHRSRHWPRRLAVAAGVLVVLGGAYVGASYALGDRVPRGATVAGVEIGGLSSSDAVATLQAQLAAATGKAIPVTVHGATSSLDPAKAGLTFDASATVARLTGVDLAEPLRLWDHLVGIGAEPAVTSVDDAKLTSAIAALGASTGKKAVDGAIVFVDGSAHETAAVDGWGLDEDAAKDVVRTSWLSGARPLELPSKTVAPTVTAAEVDRAMEDIAQPLTGAPVSVQVDGKLAVLQPLQLASAATIAPKDGSLQLTMDGKALRTAVLDQIPDLLTKPADATFQFKDDKPVLVPGKAGTQLDATTLATAVAGAAVADDRTVEVALTPTDPEASTDAMEKLGIKEIVSEFSTPLISEKIRNINIKQGATNITGTLIKPGETFSLGEALGEVDAAHGFVDAGAIVDGEHQPAMGGGLSQLSTTTYNAAYFAGFQILEHHPHSEWFTRYPEGRESTLFLPTLDMRWKNNTPYGALVQAWVADNRTYVRIWGTKYWTVKSTTSARSGVVQPTTRYSQSTTCEPASAGNPGFTVTVTRRTYLGSDLKDTTSYTTRYKPQDKVICGKDPNAPSTSGSSG